MAVALAKLQPPIIESRGLPWQAQNSGSSYASRKYLSNLVLNRNADFAKDVASKTSYEAALAKSLEAKKFWDELLEKLRKSGGGGGDMRNLDKIMTSMMFMNYLSNKMIQAILNNFKLEFLKLLGKVTNLLSPLTQNPFVQGIQRLATFISSGIAFASRGLLQQIPTKGILKSISNFSNQLTALAGAVSFQLNKLKEILEEELKEIVRKLDVKSKMKKIKETLVDLFVEMKEGVLDTFDLLKNSLIVFLEQILLRN